VDGLVWSRAGADWLRSVRLERRMTHAEFANALTAAVGWRVPTVVLRAWEDGTAVPPDDVPDAVRTIAAAGAHEIGRRQFLRQAGTVATLTLVSGGREFLTPTPSREAQPSGDVATYRPLTVRGILHPDSLTDLEGIVLDYRQSYGQASASDLLHRTSGLVQVLLDLQRAAQDPATHDRLTGILGQTSLLAGLVTLMGPHDLQAARSYYEIALSAARETEDIGLATYVAGSLSFHDFRSGQLGTAVERVRATEALADDRCSPMTRAWLASLASDLEAWVSGRRGVG
jgi:hypothetical protein